MVRIAVLVALILQTTVSSGLAQTRTRARDLGIHFSNT